MRFLHRNCQRGLDARSQALLDAIDESQRQSAYRQGYLDGMTADIGRVVNGEPVTILGFPVDVTATWNPDAGTRRYFDEQVEKANTRWNESTVSPYAHLNGAPR